MKKLFLFSTLFLIILSSQADTITIYCPPVTQLNPPTKGSIYDYKYTATTPVDIPALGDKVMLTGEANSSKAVVMYGANWTDNTFLCLYQGDNDMIVTYEGVLANYVNGCWFKNHVSECNAADPLNCPMTCEIGEGKKKD